MCIRSSTPFTITSHLHFSLSHLISLHLSLSHHISSTPFTFSSHLHLSISHHISSRSLIFPSHLIYTFHFPITSHRHRSLSNHISSTPLTFTITPTPPTPSHFPNHHSLYRLSFAPASYHPALSISPPANNKHQSSSFSVLHKLLPLFTWTT